MRTSERETRPLPSAVSIGGKTQEDFFQFRARLALEALQAGNPSIAYAQLRVAAGLAKAYDRKELSQ